MPSVTSHSANGSRAEGIRFASSDGESEPSVTLGLPSWASSSLPAPSGGAGSSTSSRFPASATVGSPARVAVSVSRVASLPVQVSVPMLPTMDTSMQNGSSRRQRSSCSSAKPTFEGADATCDCSTGQASTQRRPLGPSSAHYRPKASARRTRSYPASIPPGADAGTPHRLGPSRGCCPHSSAGGAQETRRARRPLPRGDARRFPWPLS